jgi:hypothetical protein
MSSSVAPPSEVAAYGPAAEPGVNAAASAGRVPESNIPDIRASRLRGSSVAASGAAR